MAKRLTIIGVLAAVVIGALTWFSGNASAGPCCPDIQSFDISSVYLVDAVVCYDGSPPSTPILAVPANPCGAGSSPVAAPAGATIPAYSVSRIPPGNRLSLAVTVTPSSWPATTYPCGPTVRSACNNDDKTLEAISGWVYAETNLFCHVINLNPFNADILADPASVPPNYNPVIFKRSAQGGAPSPAAARARSSRAARPAPSRATTATSSRCSRSRRPGPSSRRTRRTSPACSLAAPPRRSRWPRPSR